MSATAIAALLLQRGCPKDKLDEAFALIKRCDVKDTLEETVNDFDMAIAMVTDDPGRHTP